MQDSNNNSNDNNLALNDSKHDGMYFAAVLYRHKLFIILLTFLATAASVVITLLIPNQFQSTASVVPPKTQSSLLESAIGNISSALKDFGLTQLGGGGAKGDAGYSFMVILRSRSIADSMITRFNLANRYEIPKERMSDVRKEFYSNLEVSIEKGGNYLVTVYDTHPDTAALMANTFVEYANDIAIQLFKAEATTNRKYIEKRLNITDSALVNVSMELAKFTGKTMLFSPLDQAQAISGAYADLKARVMENGILLNIFKTSYGETDQYTKMQEKLYEELKIQLSDVENKPGFVGNFAMKDAGEIGLKYMKLFTEFETFTQLKAIIMPMLEKAKLDEQRNTKNLYIVDEAIPADKKSRPKRSLIVIGTFFGAFAASILFVVLYNAIKNFFARLKEFQNQNAV